MITSPPANGQENHVQEGSAGLMGGYEVNTPLMGQDTVAKAQCIMGNPSESSVFLDPISWSSRLL